MNDPRSAIHKTGVTHIDEVIVSISVIDSFTGRIIFIDPVDVELIGSNDNDSKNILLLKHAIRNKSGRLVFTRRTLVIDGVDENITENEKPAYKINVNAQNSGYFDPTDVLFTPPTKDDPDAATKREITISLYRLPSAPAPTDATIISGVIHKQGIPNFGTSISAEFPPQIFPPNVVGNLKPFKTLSDKRGAFSLAIRLPLEARTSTEKITFKFDDEDERNIDVPINIEEPGGKLKSKIKQGKRHSFSEAIELLGINEPELKIFGS